MVEDKKTDFPPDLKHVYEIHERTASDLIKNKEFASGELEYRNLLSAIFQAQGVTIRYHKGGPYHQIGYCLFLQEKPDDAFVYFQCAFIEDCITFESFPKLPAFLNLSHVYNTSYEDLHKLFQQVRRGIITNIPLDAEDYLNKYFKLGNKIESIPVNRERKVFVGGNYKNIAILRYIEDRVNEFKLSPILAINFREDFLENIYIHSMLLLKDCGSAIFEVTFDSGHLMEIQRALTLMHPNNILLLFQRRGASGEGEEHYITKMLLGVGVRLVGYSKIEDLPGIISEFLSKINHSLTATTSSSKTSVSTTSP